MYIKQIIIQGFKSYKEQTVIEPFSPGHNVIVGRNGSGKSNFFAAIRFVLSDAYTQMGREEREALLHEGSGSAVMSAYVEIIFDNSDDRFPTGRDEVILRRTIGQKKDEYSLDRKAATKTDVMNLLESAGFSRSNPYYIVPQGRVTTLTNMKDAERLKLLKEVAGTQVYEARRAESLKIMTETNNKRAKIDELLEYINERLDELEEEKEELRGYQEKDKERRCLEYTFYHREQIALAEALDELESSRSEGMENTEENRRAFTDGERAIAALEVELGQLNRHMDLLKIDRRQLEEDRRETAKHRAKIELEVKTLTDSQAANDQARQRHQQDLYAVQQDIANKEAELSSILPEYTRRRGEEGAIKAELANTDASVQRLYAKQGRNSKFKSKAERDTFLRREIEEYRKMMATQTSNQNDAAEEVNSVHTEIQTLEGDIAGLRQRLEGWSGNRQALSTEVANAKDALEKLSDERKVLRREDDKLGSIIESTRYEKERAERDLAHAMDAATARGLATVRRLKRERNIRGAYGTVAELLDVPEDLRIAVEQTAGNSLFHYVVDNADTATLLADALYKERGGRVTFMPLSQLRPRPINLPRAADAQPMMSVLKFDPAYEKAVAQIFGRTVICPNLSIAAQYSRSHGVDAITDSGDSTNKRGAMTGGYIDKRSSRLQAVQAVNKSRDEFENLRQRSYNISRDIEGKDHEITRSIGDLQKLEQRLRQLDDSFEPLKAELRRKVAYLDTVRDQLDSKTRRAENLDALLKHNSEQISAYELELSSEFKKSLTPEEEQQLEYLSGRVHELRLRWNEVSKGRRELENRKNLLEVDLRENLRLKQDQLSSVDFDGTSAGPGNLDEALRELNRAAKMSENIDAKLRENEAQLDEASTRSGSLQQTKIAQEQVQQETARSIERDQKIIEKGVAKKALLQASAADCAKNIRDLGVLPEEAFEKYENMDSKIVTNRLKKVNEALKQYKHVNKKAFEQYNSFTNQRETLIKRRKELDSSQASIEELVEVLDQRKDEAIERTFKQVSKYFATIFERLVPAGRGRLVIQRRADQRVQDESEDDRESVENYTGVGISVSFNSKHDEQQRIQQLSGGQKSLCALALVFAIQQCDPAPFYLFDEIDANLDAQYRTAVAEMLKSISEQHISEQANDNGAWSGQFICTTFRPEMVLVADKCYGVTFHNKTSGINVVSREKALEFVEGQKQ